MTPLLWEDEYATRFEPMLKGVAAECDTLRRLASVTLHKYLTGSRWHASGEHFADYQFRNRNIANATLDRIKKDPRRGLRKTSSPPSSTWLLNSKRTPAG